MDKMGPSPGILTSGETNPIAGSSPAESNRDLIPLLYGKFPRLHEYGASSDQINLLLGEINIFFISLTPGQWTSGLGNGGKEMKCKAHCYTFPHPKPGEIH